MASDTYTNPQTVVGADFGDAARWNRDVGDNVRFLYEPPFVEVDKTAANQSIPDDGNYHAIIWDSERLDTDSFWAAGRPSEFNIPRTGIYDVSVSLRWLGNNAGWRGLQLRRIQPSGGTAALDTTPSLTQVTDHYITRTFGGTEWVAGDILEIQVRQTSGSALSVAPSVTRCAIAWVRGPA